VRHLHELSAEFDAAGVDAAFWFSFAGYELPRRDDPRRDLDVASYGLVSVLDAGRHGTNPGWARRVPPPAIQRSYSMSVSGRARRGCASP
jgi:hypothetical protein